MNLSDNGETQLDRVMAAVAASHAEHDMGGSGVAGRVIPDIARRALESGILLMVPPDVAYLQAEPAMPPPMLTIVE